MADMRKFGATSNLIRFPLKNSSTGMPLTGLTGSSSGLIISTIADNESSATTYTQAATHIQTISTLGTFAAPTASECRFAEVDSTNHPGLYEFQIADARFAVSSAKRLVISVSGAASLLATDYEIELVQFDPFDSVHLGLTCLPNTACTTNASLLTSGSGTDQVSVSSGKVLLQATQSGVTIPTVTTVGTLTTYTGNTPQTGDSFARLGAPAGASVSADIAAVKSDTGTTLTDVNSGAGAIYSRLGAPAGASLAADVAAVKSDTGTLVTQVGTAGAGLTALGDTRIAHLNADVSSRAAPGDQMDLVNAPNSTALAAIADENNARGYQNVEDTCDKYSNAAHGLANLNSDLTTTAGKLTTHKPSDNSTLHQYPITTDVSALPITGVTG